MNKRARSMLSKFDRGLTKARKVVAAEDARVKGASSRGAISQDAEAVAAMKAVLKLIETDRAKFDAVHRGMSSNSTSHSDAPRKPSPKKAPARRAGGRGRLRLYKKSSRK
jgi:hypothetical protein